MNSLDRKEGKKEKIGSLVKGVMDQKFDLKFHLKIM